MLKVAAHILDLTDAEEEQEFIEEQLADAAELVQKRPLNIGPFFNESLRLLGFRAALQHAPAEIVRALATARDFGVGLFLRGNSPGGAAVTFSVRGHTVEVPGGPTTYNTAPRWLEAVGVCCVLRDATALETLTAYDPRNFEGVGEYDVHHVHFAAALRALLIADQDVEVLLQRAKREAQRAKVFPEHALKVDVPLIELAAVVHRRDQHGFALALVTALEGYRELTAPESQAHLAELYIPIVHLGLCALAYDQGMRVEVESTYLPSWLVSGSFPRLEN